MAEFHTVIDYIIVYARDIYVENGAGVCVTAEEDVGNYVTEFSIPTLQTRAKSKFRNAASCLVLKT